MARVEIKLPDEFTFSLDMEVRISDINMGGHLGNERLLAMFNNVQLKFLQAKGFHDLTVNGNPLINVDVAMILKAEAYFDDVLTFEAAAQDFHKYGCDIVFKASNNKTGGLVAMAKSGVLVFDYENKKPLEIPDEAKMKLMNKGG
jgi:acyl-CoA thioester hydrolase